MKIGAIAIEQLTGFKGTVTARCEYMTGVPRICIEGADSTGRPTEVWVDEARASEVGPVDQSS